MQQLFPNPKSKKKLCVVSLCHSFTEFEKQIQCGLKSGWGEKRGLVEACSEEELALTGDVGLLSPPFSSAPSPCPYWGFALMLWAQVSGLHPASQAHGGCWSVVMLRDPGTTGRRTSASWDLTGLLKGSFCRDNLMP